MGLLPPITEKKLKRACKKTPSCVSIQPIVEPGLGLCDNIKPDRFFGTERKRF